MMISLIYRKIIFSCLVAFVSIFFFIKIHQLTAFEIIGFIAGFFWMLYNIFGYLFDRDMSMRGKIIFSNGDVIRQRRTVTFVGSLIIYCLLIVGMIKI